MYDHPNLVRPSPKHEAERQLREEAYREEVEKHKQTLRQKRSIWDRIMPYRIKLERKDGTTN